MPRELLLQIFDCVFAVCVFLVSMYLIPLIRSKFSTEQLTRFKDYVSTAIRCAEQIYTAEEWLNKKEYVLNFAHDKMVEMNMELTYEDLNNIVEGLVNMIKHGGER